MRIVISSLCAAGTDEISVGFELSEGENSSKQSFIIPIDVYTAMSLSKGECDTQTYEEVEHRSGVHCAYKRGLYILGFGACSRKMLISKLRAKGFDGALSAEAVDKICAVGFLDELENAKREAEKCAEKLWGDIRIRAKLREKLYSSEAVDGALFALEDSGLDFDESCYRFIDKRYKKLPTERAELQKLIAAVSRYGYTVTQIKHALCRLDEYRRDIYNS